MVACEGRDELLTLASWHHFGLLKAPPMHARLLTPKTTNSAAQALHRGLGFNEIGSYGMIFGEKELSLYD